MELLKDREVARLLKVCSRQVRLLAKRGHLPKPVRLGRSIRWRKDDIDQFIKDGCQPTHNAVEV